MDRYSNDHIGLAGFKLPVKIILNESNHWINKVHKHFPDLDGN